jgi:hypothetical protein
LNRIRGYGDSRQQRHDPKQLGGLRSADRTGPAVEISSDVWVM